MNKPILVMLLVLVIISFLYIYLFFVYLYNQYKKATISYYKKKSSIKRYCISEKEKNNNKIKNNITDVIDHEIVNSLVGYAIIEFIDKYDRIIKTQTIFKPSLSIGREESNDVILHGQTVSRYQCLIIYQNDNFFVCNLSTSNPTFINDVAINNTVKIVSGDVIKISNYKLRFQEVIKNSKVG